MQHKHKLTINNVFADENIKKSNRESLGNYENHRQWTKKCQKSYCGGTFLSLASLWSFLTVVDARKFLDGNKISDKLGTLNNVNFHCCTVRSIIINE